MAFDFATGAMLGDPIGGGFLAGLFGNNKNKAAEEAAKTEAFRKANAEAAANPGASTSVLGGLQQANYSGLPWEAQAQLQIPALMQRQGMALLQQYLPQLTNAVNAQTLPTAQSQLDAARQISPGYNQLATQLFGQYAPELNRLGSQVAQQNATAQVAGGNQILAGPGQQYLGMANNLLRSLNPEYFSTLGKGSEGANALLDTATSQLGGKLSPTELDAIQKGLAREGQARGTVNAPSNTEVVGNAQQYGAAGYQRNIQSQNNLANAISAATSFLPNASPNATGMNANMINSVGQGPIANQVNQGAGQYAGIQSPGNSTGMSLANSFLSGFNGLNVSGMNNANSSADLQNQINANRPTTLDKILEGTQAIKNVASAAGSVAGMACWVAREVYGEHNPKWMMFREWLFNEAPKWFKNLYLTYGERFAKFIHNKPTLKLIIRSWMNTKI